MNFKRRGAETGSGFQEAINRTNEGYERAGRAYITRKAIPGKYLIERGESRRGLALPSLNLPDGGAQTRLGATELNRMVKEHKLQDWRRFIPESKAEPDYGGALAPDGRAIFYDAKTTRREALDFEGSRYVGMLAHILDGLPFTDMAPNWQVTLGRRGLLVPNRLFICYSEAASPLMLFGKQVPRRYGIVAPRTGALLREGTRASADQWIPDEGDGPRIYICCDES